VLFVFDCFEDGRVHVTYDAFWNDVLTPIWPPRDEPIAWPLNNVSFNDESVRTHPFEVKVRAERAMGGRSLRTRRI
jgi:hypothetical protein